MTASRLQHIIPASIVLLLAAVVAWLSFTQEPAGAFLFPRLISVAFLGLALWNFVRAAMGLARVGGGLSARSLGNIVPGLAVMVLLVALGARGLGFYAGSTLAFLAVYTIYDPAPVTSARDWLKRIAVTLGFMAVIYVLFALVLQVQTPRGLFF
jgi:Tripartite tricarboxylate transporter TctB family